MNKKHYIGHSYLQFGGRIMETLEPAYFEKVVEEAKLDGSRVAKTPGAKEWQDATYLAKQDQVCRHVFWT